MTARARPAFCKSWYLPRIPKSPNEVLGGHWRKLQGERGGWRTLVAAICGKPEEPVTFRVRLRLDCVRQRLLDPDNLVGSVKPVIDALKRQGWLQDDTPALLKLEVAQQKGPKQLRGVYVALRDCPEDAECSAP